MNNKVSIIMCAFDQDAVQRHITLAAIGNIERYTDEEDYELILVDQAPMGGKLTPGVEEVQFASFHWDVIDKYIVTEDIGYSAANNVGVKEATGEYLAFIHNDVFVWEGWLPKLRSYLEENICDFVAPHQRVISRKDAKKWMNMSHKELSGISGLYDAGLVMMRKKDFDKTPGWDEDFPVFYPGTVFFGRICNKNVHATPEVFITHICGITTKSSIDQRKAQDKENILLHEKYLDK